MPTLAPKEWSRQANQLQKKAGRPLERPDIEKKIGKPNGSVTRGQSLNKGGSWKPRSGNRPGQNAQRNSNLKRSTPPLTEEQKRSNTNQRQRHRRSNGKIDKHADKHSVGHKEPAWKSGEQHERLEKTHGKEHADKIRDKNQKAREKVGGGLGDHPNNRQTETNDSNGKANGEYKELEGALEDMERKNPSNPDNPSANYFQEFKEWMDTSTRRIEQQRKGLQLDPRPLPVAALSKAVSIGTGVATTIGGGLLKGFSGP